LRAGDRVSHELQPERRAFLYVIEGEVRLGGEPLAAGDQARILDRATLAIAGVQQSEIILIDLP
jgi:hypothetical protein